MSIFGTTATIVLVEDDDAVRETVAAMVEELGHRCIAFDSAQKVLDALRCRENGTTQTCVVFTDFDLGIGYNGLELAKMVRDEFGIAAAITSGRSDHEVDVAKHFFDFWPKPVRLTALETALSTLISRWQLKAA